MLTCNGQVKRDHQKQAVNTLILASNYAAVARAAFHTFAHVAGCQMFLVKLCQLFDSAAPGLVQCNSHGSSLQRHVANACSFTAVPLLALGHMLQ